MDLVVVSEPVFWSTLAATLIPFVTALLVRIHASAAFKATVATVLSLATAFLATWKNADDAGSASSTPKSTSPTSSPRNSPRTSGSAAGHARRGLRGRPRPGASPVAYPPGPLPRRRRCPLP